MLIITEVKHPMMVIVGIAIGAIVAVFALIVYSLVYAAMNTAALPASALTMVNIIPVVLAAGIVIAILVGTFAFAMRGGR